tara:strand:- start:5747 stop:7438 length:1692 start_codon:yes stop_codon:yes gene_type:complete
MAIEKIGIEVEVKSKKAESSLDQLQKKLENVSKAGSDNREGFKVLDQVTGGYASQIKGLAGSVGGAIKGVKSFTKGLKGLRGALISTGIGALVVALGLIVVYWDDIINLVSGVNKETTDLLAQQEKYTASAELAFKAIGETSNTLKLQGKSERDILNAKKLQTKEIIKALEAQIITQEAIKKSQVEASKRNKFILTGILVFIERPITAVLDMVDALTKGLSLIPGLGDIATNLGDSYRKSGGIAGLVFDPEAIDKKGDEAANKLKDQLTKLKNQRDGFTLQQQAQDKKAEDDKKAADEKKIADAKVIRDKKAEDIKAAKEAAKKLEDDEKAKALEEIARLEEEFNLNQLTKEEQEKVRVIAKYAFAINQAKKFNEDTVVLEAAKAKALKAIKDKFSAEDKARVQLLEESKLDAIKKTFGQVASILGKKSAIGKAAAIASATINTYQGISEVWANESVLPSPFDVIQKAVSSVAVLQAGLKTVQQIKSVKKPAGVTSGGGGGGGGGAVPSFTPPSFSAVGSSGTNQLADVIAEQSNTPSRSYVVAGDVTTAQQLERDTIDAASI